MTPLVKLKKKLMREGWKMVRKRREVEMGGRGVCARAMERSSEGVAKAERVEGACEGVLGVEMLGELWGLVVKGSSGIASAAVVVVVVAAVVIVSFWFFLCWWIDGFLSLRRAAWMRSFVPFRSRYLFLCSAERCSSKPRY